MQIWKMETGGTHEDFAKSCGIDDVSCISRFKTGRGISKDSTVLENAHRV